MREIRAESRLEGSGLGPRWGVGVVVLASSVHLAGQSQVGFERGGLRRFPGFRCVQTPTWQQPVVVAVGPGPARARPGWTEHPQGTTLMSRRQGPHQAASGSGGGTLEPRIRAHPGNGEA